MLYKDNLKGLIRLIYYVHGKYEMRESDFNNTWDRVIHLRQKAFKDLEVNKDISEMGVSKFDIRLGYSGATYYRTEKPTHTFGFDRLDEDLDDVHTIMKDIHRVLEEHDVETIDVLYKKERDAEGIVIVFHTNNVIEHVLYYPSYEEEVETGYTMSRYKQVEHFNEKINDNILRIALELDYMTSKKEKFIFSKYTLDFGEEVRLFLRNCLEKKIPTNYSFNDTKTREEKEEEKRQKREEERQKQRQEQLRKQQEQQKQQQEQMEQLQQFQQQFQQMQQQMMQMMSMYQMYKQVKEEEYDDEYEDDFEEFEEDEE